MTWLLLVTFALSVASATVWVRTATVRSTYESLKLHKDLRTRQAHYNELRMQWLRLTAPAKLEALAKKLDMHQPDRNHHRHYENHQEQSHQHAL